MNILAMHTSHDGAITVVKDDQFVLHTQIDRFNHILSSAVPSHSLLIKIKKLKIKFDCVLITFLDDSGHWLWEQMLRNYDIMLILKLYILKETIIIYFIRSVLVQQQGRINSF